MLSTNGKPAIEIPTPNGVVTSRPPVSQELSLPRTLWRAWQDYGHRVAGYQSEILFSVVYLLILGPSGIVARLFGRDLMDLSQRPCGSYWITRKPTDTSLQGMQRQY